MPTRRQSERCASVQAGAVLVCQWRPIELPTKCTAQDVRVESPSLKVWTDSGVSRVCAGSRWRGICEVTALTSVVEESIDHVLSLLENDERVWQSNSGTGLHESVASQEQVATVVSFLTRNPM